MEERLKAMIIAYLEKSQYGTFFQKEEIITNICSRFPFQNQEDIVRDVLGDLIKSGDVIETPIGVRLDTARKVVRRFLRY